MLHKAEECKMISHSPKIKLMKEHGRHLRLDDEAERKLQAAASVCEWRQRTQELFHDVVILMRDTGMRNQRELYRMRIEGAALEHHSNSSDRNYPTAPCRADPHLRPHALTLPADCRF
jgi:hypothetical protein